MHMISITYITELWISEKILKKIVFYVIEVLVMIVGTHMYIK